MHLADMPRRFGEHRNAFGFLRLLFAFLVILSHIPVIVDNNTSREILYRITGFSTFGGFAVNGFFLISGYLIAGSLINSNNPSSYIKKRVFRIYPGFVVASIICLVVVAPLADASFNHGALHTVLSTIVRMAILARPAVVHAFPGQHFNDYDTALNGAMWTIQYEFFCYLLLLPIYYAKLLRGWIVILLAMILLGIGTWLPDDMMGWLSRGELFPGKPISLFQLTGMFLSGSAWYIYRKEVYFSGPYIVLSIIGLLFCLSYRETAQIGFAALGGYGIFACAKIGTNTVLEKINNKNDISYGVYIYAWPAEQLLIRYVGSKNLLLLGIETWVIAIICGWLSWTLVERPMLNLMRSHAKRRDDVATASATGLTQGPAL